MVLNKTYNQKSKLFLLPLLEIRRNPLILPVDTYLIDKQKGLSISDRRLIVPYEKDESSEFAEYENFLVGCDYFDGQYYYETKNCRVYVYDLSDMAEEYDKFLHGRYTEFSKSTKTLINIYWGRINRGKFEHHSQIQKYLNPTKGDYEALAEELDVPLAYITEGKQVLDRPNLLKETFQVKEVIDETRIY